MHAGFSYADPNAGVHGAFAILTALYHRDNTGEGQYIDMSQWECAMAVLPEGILEYTMNGREPERIGNRDPQMAPHGIFKCLDRPEKVLGFTVDQFVAIAAADDGEWQRMAAAMGRPELANDPQLRNAGGAQDQRGRTGIDCRSLERRTWRPAGRANTPGRGCRGLRGRR